MRKKLQTLLVSIILFACTGMAQTFYTVDNRPGLPANYHTLQGAIDSVAPGSVLMLQASGQNYGAVVIRKPLVIYGAGYFIGQNNAPNTQAKLGESMVANINFLNGSQGSKVSGLSFSVSSFDGQLGLRTRLNSDSTSNITISRCKIIKAGCNCPGGDITCFLQNSSNITITQCYLDVSGGMMGLRNSTAILFTNNVIVGDVNFVSNQQAPFDYRFENNSLWGRISSVDFANGTFVNNVIIQNPAETVYLGTPMTFADHNVSNVNIFPGGGSNISNADGANTYTIFSNPAISSQDGIWQLKPGSVAIGYGTGGIDCGAYGGSKPYVLSGIPAIPNFYFADPQQAATGSGGLNIHFKIKANN